MGERCEMRDYDGKDAVGKPCERDAIGKDSRGRWVCERHSRKIPDHVRERREGRGQ
jgi:hypothetical protein